MVRPARVSAVRSTEETRATRAGPDVITAEAERNAAAGAAVVKDHIWFEVPNMMRSMV